MAALDLSRFTSFDWDAGNRDKNWLKHKVTLSECEQSFFNQPLMLLDNARHSEKETRTLLLGRTDAGRLLAVTFTQRGTKLRVIVARDMVKRARELYRHGR